ncbi:hypothetical protein DVH24_038494 [Malus domestica]|uniref:CS domain-containing protein n=1 Tax=Malus domestica TaxID=3750 RepID=A0A498K7J9_MALDO|nr:hypothetical protein DVH24_038494 [Malus domestica]
MAEKLAPEKRHSFVHNGQKVFEWDQTLEESKHVEVGIKGNPPFLNIEAFAIRFKPVRFSVSGLQHDLTCPVKTDCSFWTLEDDIMHITLQKRDKGQTWASPIVGEGQLDPYSTDLEQKRLMLQRFQEENPGFDFSQAQFTGGCPDPRTFMGGSNTPDPDILQTPGWARAGRHSKLMNPF